MQFNRYLRRSTTIFGLSYLILFIILDSVHHWFDVSTITSSLFRIPETVFPRLTPLDNPGTKSKTKYPMYTTANTTVIPRKQFCMQKVCYDIVVMNIAKRLSQPKQSSWLQPFSSSSLLVVVFSVSGRCLQRTPYSWMQQLKGLHETGPMSCFPSCRAALLRSSRSPHKIKSFSRSSFRSCWFRLRLMDVGRFKVRRSVSRDFHTLGQLCKGWSATLTRLQLIPIDTPRPGQQQITSSVLLLGLRVEEGRFPRADKSATPI